MPGMCGGSKITSAKPLEAADARTAQFGSTDWCLGKVQSLPLEYAQGLQPFPSLFSVTRKWTTASFFVQADDVESFAVSARSAPCAIGNDPKPAANLLYRERFSDEGDRCLSAHASSLRGIR